MFLHLTSCCQSLTYFFYALHFTSDHVLHFMSLRLTAKSCNSLFMLQLRHLHCIRPQYHVFLHFSQDHVSTLHLTSESCLCTLPYVRIVSYASFHQRVMVFTPRQKHDFYLSFHLIIISFMSLTPSSISNSYNSRQKET